MTDRHPIVKKNEQELTHLDAEREEIEAFCET